MDKKKNEKQKIETFEDAMRLIFENLVPKGEDVSVVQVRLQPEADELMTDEEELRDEIITMMTDEELYAYDALDTYLNSPKAGLPDDDSSLESCLEHADWNTDERREEIAELLAGLEAEISFYVNLKIYGANGDILADALEGIQAYLDLLPLYSRELELLERITTADYRANEASVVLNEALEERDILMEMLEEHYEKYGAGDGSGDIYVFIEHDPVSMLDDGK